MREMKLFVAFEEPQDPADPGDPAYRYLPDLNMLHLFIPYRVPVIEPALLATARTYALTDGVQ